MDMAQNLRARVTQVVGFGSIYQGEPFWYHFFEPQPHVDVFLLLLCGSFPRLVSQSQDASGSLEYGSSKEPPLPPCVLFGLILAQIPCLKCKPCKL